MRQLIITVCTGLGLGYSPIAPGTVGTLLGIPLAWYFADQLWIILAIAALGIWASHRGEEYFGCKDSQKIVIDEIAGYMVAMFALPHYMIIPAFILFRIFDIAKPGFIKKVQHWPGGWGVMADDLLAGLFANIILHIANYLLF